MLMKQSEFMVSLEQYRIQIFKYEEERRLKEMRKFYRKYRQ